MPWDVDELVPPSPDNNGDVEAKHERQRNEVCKALAVDRYMFKHSAIHTHMSVHESTDNR